MSVNVGSGLPAAASDAVDFLLSSITPDPLLIAVPSPRLGICPVMTEDNRDQLTGKDLLVAYFNIDYVRNPSGCNYWRNRCVAPGISPTGSGDCGIDEGGTLTVNSLSSRVMKVAKTFLGQGRKLNFAVADKVKNQHSLSEFGIDDSLALDSPIVTIKTAKGVKYAMKETFS